MMSKSAIKFYIIPGLIGIVVILVILLLPLGKKKTETNVPSITPISTTNSILPTQSLAPTSKVTPTLIPPQSFTGASANQELPTDLKIVGEQKTALRRLTPLALPFGVIEFDYGHDQFLVRLSEPRDDSRIKFSVWREQNYPALVDSNFIIN